jgi:hypothetical protein
MQLSERAVEIHLHNTRRSRAATTAAHTIALLIRRGEIDV